MKQIIKIALVGLACFAMNVAAQDWYHDRERRFQGEGWRGHLFEHVKMDLEHVPSAAWAAQREKNRLVRTRQELTDLQIKLDHGRFDNGELNDVIDSLVKSSHDERLSPRDREVLADDVVRLRDYREHHDHWIR